MGIFSRSSGASVVSMFALKCLVFLSAALAASCFSLQPGDVVFHLLTRLNPVQSQVLSTVSSIEQSNINPNNPTIYLIHTNGNFDNFNAFIVPAFLTAGDVNVIAVDWRAGSSSYTEGLAQAKQCGERIAQFINMIIANFGPSRAPLKFVGVGLGAHIAGIAARNVVETIPHIVALDPALHGWSHHPDILNPGDAELVEVLHTNAGFLGYDYPLGHVDFYANGGALQPNCFGNAECSRTYSYVYYAESLTAPLNNGPKFVGTACESYEEAATASCTGERDAVFGGPEVKSELSGIYLFFTNFVAPYARD